MPWRNTGCTTFNLARDLKNKIASKVKPCPTPVVSATPPSLPPSLDAFYRRTILKIYAALSGIARRCTSFRCAQFPVCTPFNRTESGYTPTRVSLSLSLSPRRDPVLSLGLDPPSRARETREIREGETQHFLISRNDCSLLIGARCSRYRAPSLRPLLSCTVPSLPPSPLLPFDRAPPSARCARVCVHVDVRGCLLADTRCCNAFNNRRKRRVAVKGKRVSLKAELGQLRISISRDNDDNDSVYSISLIRSWNY